jgi:uncharacterized protein (TIGR02996 family)
MTDHDALLAAICNEPDEDTPRLALADWLDENEQADQAAFIRAQIELARTPPWEPFAVLCRWRQRDWLTGKPFRGTLPPVDGIHVEWHEEAFRRGLGWRLKVRSLVAWEQSERAILGRAPVGAMHLWSAATLDDWRRFAASPVTRNLREVHLVASPIEPLRALRETPAVPPITDIYFERASGAGTPFVVEDLLASPLGGTLRGLHFHMGYDEAIDEMVGALEQSSALQRLSLRTMGFTQTHIDHLLSEIDGSSLIELDLGGNPLEDDGVRSALRILPVSIRTLGLSDTHVLDDGLRAFVESRTNINRLDLSRNPLPRQGVRMLSQSQHLASLRSLNLRKCRIEDWKLGLLTQSRFWPNLVELDLRENPIPPAGVRHLLDAPVPADLTALVLTGDTLGTDSRDELRRKFGERVVFVESEVVGI